VYIGPLLCTRNDYTVLVRRVGFMLTNVKQCRHRGLIPCADSKRENETRNLRVISESYASINCGNPNVWRRLFVGHAEFSSIHLRAAANNQLVTC